MPCYGDQLLAKTPRTLARTAYFLNTLNTRALYGILGSARPRNGVMMLRCTTSSSCRSTRKRWRHRRHHHDTDKLSEQDLAQRIQAVIERISTIVPLCPANSCQKTLASKVFASPLDVPAPPTTTTTTSIPSMAQHVVAVCGGHRGMGELARAADDAHQACVQGGADAHKRLRCVPACGCKGVAVAPSRSRMPGALFVRRRALQRCPGVEHRNEHCFESA